LATADCRAKHPRTTLARSLALALWFALLHRHLLLFSRDLAQSSRPRWQRLGKPTKNMQRSAAHLRSATTDASGSVALAARNQNNSTTSKSLYSGQGPIKKTKRWSQAKRLPLIGGANRWVQGMARGPSPVSAAEATPHTAARFRARGRTIGTTDWLHR